MGKLNSPTSRKVVAFGGGSSSSYDPPPPLHAGKYSLDTFHSGRSNSGKHLGSEDFSKASIVNRVTARWCPCCPATSKKVGQRTSGLKKRTALIICLRECSYPQILNVWSGDFEKPKSRMGSSSVSANQQRSTPRTFIAFPSSSVLNTPKSSPRSRPRAFCPPWPRTAFT